jgi:hypothetical protein
LSIGFAGNTQAFFQFDSDSSALEFEFCGQGILNGTVFVNGVTAWAVNAGFTGIERRTIFTNAGSHRSMVSFVPGQSHVGVGIKSINMYEVASGATLGVLSRFDTMVDAFSRGGVHNATITTVNARRIYADQLYLQGDWARQLSASAPGLVQYVGASTNSKLLMRYYGKGYAVLGTAGGSMSWLFDGLSTAVQVNSLQNNGTSLAWHTLEATYQAGSTAVISAFDYITGDRSEVLNLQNYTSDMRLEEVTKVYKQANTPQKAKNGDLWLQELANQLGPTSAWIRIDDLWHQLSFTAIADDPIPNGLGFVFGGSNGSAMNSIEFISLITKSNSQSFANLANSRFLPASSGNSLRGITVSGSSNLTAANAQQNSRYITYAIKADAVDFGNNSTRIDLAASANNIITVNYGGRDSSGTNTAGMRFATIASPGAFAAFGNITTLSRGNAACGNRTIGILACGIAPATFSSRIEYVLYSALANSVVFGNLSSARSALASASNSVYAIFVAGDNGSDVSTIDRVAISTSGTASQIGNILIPRASPGAHNNNYRVVVSGGYNSSNIISDMQEFGIQTGGLSSKFGDLLGVRGAHGFTSNSHGGV